MKRRSLYILVFLWFLAFCGDAFGDYCSASGGGSYEHIIGVEVGTISNMTGWSSYTDYTYLSTEMYIGHGYSITVTNGNAYSGDQCGVWVDWNADEDFDDVNETIVMSGGPETFTGTITPPVAAVFGATRMRVRVMYTGVLSPCGTTNYGEVEDYTVVVIEPYEIWTAEDLQAIGADANYWDEHFRLMADIDLSAYTGTSFNIIGTIVPPGFTGVFDGNGHTISNFTYDSSGTRNIGLFGYINDASAEIRNVGLINANVIGGTNAGSLVGQLSRGAIIDCYVKGGSVSGDERVGGLVGSNSWGTISDCCVDDTSVSASGYFVGGLVGMNNGSVSGSHSTGSVSGDWYVGGLAGYNPGEISQCRSASYVIGNQFTGGLVGNNGGDVVGIISSSYSTGTVQGWGSTGGLTGFNCEGFIVNCYSTGSVSGDWYVGGLVGQNHFGSVSNSYSASRLEGGYVGGLSGGSTGGTHTTYTKCFWDVNVNPDVNGIWNAYDPNVIGKTTVEMQTRNTFTDAGWDFVGEVINGPNDIWDICEGTNYPKFVWQIPEVDFVCPDGVTFVDYSVFGAAWLSEAGYANWDPNCDISEPNDNVIDEKDLAVFCDNWLVGL